MQTQSSAEPGEWTLSLSHGTIECRELDPSRRFYRDFLGLETVKRGDMAIWFRCGGGWMVASVCTGEKQVALPIESRWCLDMTTADEVDAAHEAATRLAESYGITEVRPVEVAGDRRSFCLRDLDDNWWEVAYRPGRLYDEVFGATTH